ncbi:MAG: DNA alkylation repair protein [Flavobacterium sp.]|nr:DNA alkylation repair protein [Flavobacterium sp.]
MDFISQLETTFNQNKNEENAFQMKKYMKDFFSFYGIKTTERRAIFLDLLKSNQQEISENYREIALILLNKEYRELHYCGIEILIKNLKKNYRKDDIKLIETFLITNSWWDSVDTISKYLLGQYLMEFPNETEKVIERFSNSNNMWLNRSAIIFQLGYKKNTNYELLFSECVKHSQSKEFFIQKAIGWALREYGSVNPGLVLNFVNNTDLKPLSRKEAIRKLI